MTKEEVLDKAFQRVEKELFGEPDGSNKLIKKKRGKESNRRLAREREIAREKK